MLQIINDIWKDQRGATLLEYAGLAVLILLAVWAAANALGRSTGATFTDIKDKLGH